MPSSPFLPPPPSPVSYEKKRLLVDWRGGGGRPLVQAAKSYDAEETWSSIIHLMLSGTVHAVCRLSNPFLLYHNYITKSSYICSIWFYCKFGSTKYLIFQGLCRLLKCIMRYRLHTQSCVIYTEKIYIFLHT